MLPRSDLHSKFSCCPFPFPTKQQLNTNHCINLCPPAAPQQHTKKMEEVVTEEQPRIKFQCQRQGDCEPLSLDTPGLQDLIKLCQRMEELGAAPVLNDGLVGGNAGILVVSEASMSCTDRLRRPPAPVCATPHPLSYRTRPASAAAAPRCLSRAAASRLRCIWALATLWLSRASMRPPGVPPTGMQLWCGAVGPAALCWGGGGTSHSEAGTDRLESMVLLLPAALLLLMLLAHAGAATLITAPAATRRC